MHKTDNLNDGYMGSGKLIQKAIKKYGIENFTFDVLLICFDEDRYKYEIEYIQKYNSLVPNGYNILEGGPGGGFKGKTHSEETKKRMSENKKGVNHPNYGKKVSEEKLKKMSEVMKGVNLGRNQSQETIEKRKIKLMNNPEIKEKISNSLKEYYKNNANSYETRQKISNSLKEYHKNKVTDCLGRTDEVKQKISERLKEYHKNKIVKINLIRINQYDINNNLINSFNTIIDASRATNIRREAISRTCLGKTKSGGGFIWKRE
jgi:hypothetical protein